MKHSSPYQRGLWADMARGFQGPGRGLMILVFADVLVVFALCVVCLVGLLHADDTRSQILFGVFFLACLLAVGLLKMWFFQRLDRLAILDALEEIRDRRDR
jgi:hypothetical protein